ncbi:hypothetical protein CYMTET_3145, partial [Cymbomonas tetramitiformis]
RIEKDVDWLTPASSAARASRGRAVAPDTDWGKTRKTRIKRTNSGNLWLASTSVGNFLEHEFQRLIVGPENELAHYQKLSVDGRGMSSGSRRVNANAFSSANLHHQMW